MNITLFRLVAALGMAAILPTIASAAFAYTGEKHNQVTQEVGVDAAAGLVLANKAEGHNPD